MKIQLELNAPGDGRVFLNHWDYRSGNDTVCEVVDGTLMKQVYDEDSNECPPVPISIQDFINEVMHNSHEQ